MSLRDGLKVTNEFLNVILKLFFIIAAVLGILWFGASIWANVTEGGAAIPAMPDINKAPYMVMIKATGDMLLTAKYDTIVSPDNPADKVYTIHGSYRLEKNKWQYSSGVVSLNEYYFGDITIKRREK